MAYTIQDGLDDIRHELGGELVGINALRCLNEAGQKLYALRDWNFLVRVGVPLPSVAAQSWIELPEDFGQIVTLQFTNGLTAAVSLSTLQQINEYRSQLVTIPSYMLYATVSWVVDAGAVIPRLEVFPSPSTTDAALLTLTYRVRWVTLNATTDDTPLEIPEWFEPVYRQAVRATAYGYQKGEMNSRWADLRQSIDFLSAERQDGAQQVDFGQLRNGAMSMAMAGEDVQWSLSLMPLPPAPGY